MSKQNCHSKTIGIIKGYNSDMLYREWRRRIVEAEERKINREFNHAWKQFKINTTPENYQATVVEYLRTISPYFDAEYKAKPMAKEIQASKWLVLNCPTTLRFNREYSYLGNRNSDIFWQEEFWEIKRIESDNTNKIYQRAKDASEQAENVIIDLSLYTISAEDFMVQRDRLLEKLPIRKLGLLIEGKFEIEKR